MRVPRLLWLVCLASLAHAQDPASPQVATKAAPGTPHAAEAALSSAGDAATPFPDTHALLSEVDRKFSAAESRSREYTYRVHMRNEQLNSAGAIKKVVETDAESFTIDGVRVNKVYARDGKPLTPDEARKEDQAVDKTVARAKQHRVQHQEKGQPTDAQGDVLVTAARLEELGTFSNMRPGTYAGRPVWLLDYNGNPAARTHNEFEGLLRNLSGTAWIDRQDHVLVAAHGEFHKDFKVGAGLLVNIHKGSSFEYRATKVDDDVWLLDTFRTAGSLRYLLFGGFNGRIFVHASDYRKFRTSTTILPSNRVIGPDGKPVPEQTPVETRPGAAAEQTRPSASTAQQPSPATDPAGKPTANPAAAPPPRP